MTPPAPTSQDGEGLGAVSVWSTPGHDRDCARAIWQQARNQRNPLSTTQVEHLLSIGYTAARRTATAESSEAVHVLADALYGDRDGSGDHTVVTIAEEAAPLVRLGRQLRDMLDGAEQRRGEPATLDDPAARLVAEVRRECAEELSGLLPDPLPSVGDEGAAVAVSKLRALATLWYSARWSGSGRTPDREGDRK